jgi:UDP-N-acetylglucosamine 2-epimerase (non-hydrolysing)
MPEEINRVLTDQISELLFTTERKGLENLVREGIDEAKIRFVGNVMIDTLRHNQAKAVPVSAILKNVGAERILAGKEGYAVLTLHRPSNVDHEDTLRDLLQAVRGIAHKLPVIFPIHPRTSQMADKFGLRKLLDVPNIVQLPPMGYLEMLGLLQEARIALTDSGGLQEESTALGIPCLTLRKNTERLITVTEGTNTIVGQKSADILAAFDEVMRTGGKRGRIPEFWDGGASLRIATEIQQWLEAAPQR